MEAQFESGGRSWDNLAVCRGSNPLFSTNDNQTRLSDIRIKGNTAIGFILSDDKILYHRLPKPPLIPMTYFWVLVVNTLAVLD